MQNSYLGVLCEIRSILCFTAGKYNKENSILYLNDKSLEFRFNRHHVLMEIKLSQEIGLLSFIKQSTYIAGRTISISTARSHPKQDFEIELINNNGISFGKLVLNMEIS